MLIIEATVNRLTSNFKAFYIMEAKKWLDIVLIRKKQID